MKKRIDLNVDIGEGFPFDEDLLPWVTTANICCGAHAGSGRLAAHTLGLCRAKGVRPCAHPGYPDRDGMGRASQPLETSEHEAALARSLREQIKALPGVTLLKPHGALYHDTSQSEPHAALLTSLMIRWNMDLVGFPVGRHRAIARASGRKFLAEGFVDRQYEPDGTLTPRSQPGAVLQKEGDIKAQALALAEKVDTLCLHGDTPHCVEIARLVRIALQEHGWTVGAP